MFKRWLCLFLCFSLFFSFNCLAIAETPVVESAVNETITDNTESGSTQPAKKAKKEESSFKRFEFSYESRWLRGNYWEDTWQSNGSVASFNWKLRTRLDVYKGAFYITPKTNLEGSFAVGHIAKNLPGWVNDFGFLTESLSVTGEKIQMWNLDLCQNVYTHKNSGLAFDILLGYINYQERTRTIMVSPASIDPWLTFHREYKGLRVGTKLKVPFAFPGMKRKMFAIKGSYFYAPNLTMKSTGDNWGWGAGNSALSNSGRGNLMETHAGLVIEPVPNMSLEVMYNYYKFMQKKSGYYAGVIPDLTIHKAKTTLHGPSVAISCRF